MIRRLLIVSILALAATSLVACGKKGTPLPPGESDYPRVYPNPSKYGQPSAPVGTSNRNTPPEQGSTGRIDDNEDDLGFNPGRMSR
ncbi:MAG TPA: hypothetical protein VL966_06730 [Alphaproteobacteria bacterium]|nr:hypothetical protein [Alphaproteobacteria bacterium]